MSSVGIRSNQVDRNIRGLTGVSNGQWHRRGSTQQLIRIMGQFVIRSPDTGTRVTDAPGLGEGRSPGDIGIIRDGYIRDERSAVRAIGGVGGLKGANRRRGRQGS